MNHITKEKHSMPIPRRNGNRDRFACQADNTTPTNNKKNSKARGIMLNHIKALMGQRNASLQLMLIYRISPAAIATPDM